VIFFLSGLPRSGSTLLQTILSQNPDIQVGGNSPLCQLMWDAKESCETKSYEQLFASKKLNFKDEYLKSIPKLYYKNSSKYVLDKCRTWTLEENVKMIKKYIDPDPKIIAMVRPLEEIVGSFQYLIKDKNIPELGEEKILTPHSEPIMRPLSGLVNFAKNPENKKNILIIEYKNLVNHTLTTIESIYKFINVDMYNHDLKNIEQKEKEDDLVYKIPNLHEVRKTIKTIPREYTLSENTKKLCSELDRILNDSIKDLL
jgi:sulfotransferase